GDHSYENQLEGLKVAEPFFGSNCIVMVDDTNWTDPREATADFVEQSEYEYRVLLDERTSINEHPTFWNGLIILQLTNGKDAGPGLDKQPSPLKPSVPIRSRSKARSDGTIDGNASELVSIVIHNDQDDEDPLRAAIEGCLDQSW